ncbi:MAG TPA: PIN domain-containing protein [Longimicrobium sp.]
MPAGDAPVVVDTNIIFSALLRLESRILHSLLTSGRRLLICETILVELFRHQDRIRRHSTVGDDHFGKLLHDILRRIEIYKEDLIPDEYVARAMDLCVEIDPADAIVVALTLAADGLLWTGDRKLRRGLEIRGFDRFYDPPHSQTEAE